MSTHNIGFYEDLTKIIFEISSNTHLISFADINCKCVKLFTIFSSISTLPSNKLKLKHLNRNQITIKLTPTSLMHFPTLLYHKHVCNYFMKK